MVKFECPVCGRMARHESISGVDGINEEEIDVSDVDTIHARTKHNHAALFLHTMDGDEE